MNIKPEGQNPLFDCDLCQGPVILTRGPGRVLENREVPPDFPMPTCHSCGEVYLNMDESSAIESWPESKKEFPKAEFRCTSCGFEWGQDNPLTHQRCSKCNSALAKWLNLKEWTLPHESRPAPSLKVYSNP